MFSEHPPHVRVCDPSDREGLVALWEVCGLIRPWNDPRLDIERKLRHDTDGLLVLDVDGRVTGSVMVGYDGHRGWVNYLAVEPARRRNGYGALLMSAAERRLAALGCPKINLQVRSSNDEAVAFYQRLGYATDDVVSLGKRLIDAG